MTAAGGTVTVPDVGSIAFPPQAFADAATVRASVTHEPEVDDLFNATAATLLSADHRVPYELRVDVGSAQPAAAATVSLKLPAPYRATLRSTSQIRVFAANVWDDPDSAVATFEMLPERFPFTSESVTVSVPPHFFTDGVGGGGTFTLTLLVATAPTVPDEATLPPTESADTCSGATLRPPLDGELTVTSPFSTRTHPVLKKVHQHSGTDYQAAEGTNVKAMADGVVEYSRYEVKESNGTVVGYGHYIVLRHKDGSGSLYAHLQEGSLAAKGTAVHAGDTIAKSGKSGGVTGPHLHVEYSPNGTVFTKDSRVDPAACIGAGPTGSITVQDDNSPGSAFTVAVDRRHVCEVTVGGQRSCVIGGLHPGIRQITITAMPGTGGDHTRYKIILNDGLKFPNGATEQTDYIYWLTRSNTVNVNVPEPAK
ncbi:hypothetical protein Vau01_108770 [Virgisporangium aurantiacum]|uniref:M23ase beta-sheet core domain-containing protein n=1 Tax=Virgisporangium aurantiacum TaxID=175570 RepID=A0A8J3ZGC6_9ACTN|nr:hypothetical protein Vau01_108770 [Virgisporangium aurantiacum]